MKRLTLFLLGLCVCTVTMFASYLTNYPISVTQPDGTVVQCYATGDEYHHRIHDANGYTIVRDPQTGYLAYALLVNDELIASGYSVGKVDPKTVGLTPDVDLSVEKRTQIRKAFLDKTPQIEKTTRSTSSTQYFNTGTLNNIVIFIRFADEPEFTTSKATYEQYFNQDVAGASMYRYYKDISRGMLSLPSTFYPVTTGNTILSYQDINPRSIYENATDDQQAGLEHALLRRAVESVRSQIPTSLNLDYNNDGRVDNVCFVIDGDAGAWSSLLWPHRWVLYSQNVSINGKRVYDYNLILENHLLTVGNGKQSVLVHETYHTLGAPDLYHYTGSSDPVGSWDVMCSNTVPPQSSTAYITWKYGGWIDAIPEITESGTYTLHNVWASENNCYKIVPPGATTSEYIMVEYRNKSVIWDSRLPGSGLIFYRVNPSLSGNSSGPPDEVYVFRSGSLNAAFFSAQSGRTTFSDTSEPACVLSDGSPGLKGMVIDQISASGGETMTFRVSFPDVSVPIAKTATQIVVEGFTANWYSSINKDGYLLSVYYKRNGQKTYDSGGFEDRPIGDITSYNVTGLDRSLPTTRWYYCVKAKSGDLLSDASNEIPVTLAPIASAPSATDATGEKRFGFTARWNVAANAVGYLLSVYYKEDGENRYEAGGFQDRLVETGTSSLVTNLDRAVSTQWYYMVKAVSAGGSPTGLSNEIAVQLSDQYDPVGCEYAANILSGEGKTVTYFSQSEYVTGHNNYQLAEFAEYYRVQGLSKISAVKMNVFAAKNNSNNSNYAKITVKIWSKTNDGLPGNVLYSKDVALNTIILGENVFNLETPVYVSGDFFVGYQIYYALVNRDVFAVYQTVFGSHPDNTAYIRYGNDWYTTNDLFGDTYYSAALFVFPNICTFLPEPAFVAGETTVEKGNAIQFTNQTVASSETIWLWDFGDGSISREKDPEHIYDSGGVYTVKLTAENNVGLIDLSKTNYITITGGTSVASLQNGVEKIYPNPAKNRLTVETEQPAQIQIYSITGALLLQQKINATTVINIDKLRSGVYILKILGADKHLSNYRLIVE